MGGLGGGAIKKIFEILGLFSLIFLENYEIFLCSKYHEKLSKVWGASLF